MSRRFRPTSVVVATLAAAPVSFACEPVVPFMQVVAPAAALSGSLVALAAAVVFKSVLFAIFERRISRVRAGSFMFLGNVLTSVIGIIAAAMLGSGAAWLVGVPLVFLLCWLPARRLVEVAPRGWFAGRSPWSVAALLTGALVISCILFMSAQGVLLANGAKGLVLYWTVKLVAVYLALIASIALTTVWEEWAIWRLAAKPRDTSYFGSVLRSNIYVLVVIMAVAAVAMLPKRLKSPDFLTKRHGVTIARTAGAAQPAATHLAWRGVAPAYAGLH